MGLILLILLILLLCGCFGGQYNGSWGAGPSGIVGLLLIIILVLFLLGHI